MSDATAVSATVVDLRPRLRQRTDEEDGHRLLEELLAEAEVLFAEAGITAR
jgi:hypothetical protein